jgi:hypothetical protein
MSTRTKRPAAPVARALRVLAPHASTEEALYLCYARLRPAARRALAEFFGEEDPWRLWRRLRRALARGREGGG